MVVAKVLDRLAVSWLNWTVTWRVYQVIALGLVIAILGLLIVQQIESNDARDRARDQRAGIERSYLADLRAWEAGLRQNELCLERVAAQDALRAGLLSQNGLLRDILQIIEDANPGTEVFTPLFDKVDANRAQVEVDYAPYPTGYCPTADPEPVRPLELD